jgi:dTDP-4-dehydrorhamnose reductase
MRQSNIVPLPHRVLIFGASGQLGGEVLREWKDVELITPPHTEVDITDVDAVARVMERHAPDTVLNLAAFHNVERCEREPANALLANAVAVNAMAQACAARDSAFVTISTDYVFDGELGRPYTEGDTPRPISAYGVSKYAGELLVQRLQSRAYIVRTCGVYATRASTSKGHTFIDRIIRQAKNGEPIRIVRDQTVSPTYARHLARGLLRLLQSDAPIGVYHMVNEGPVTWYDYASEALRVAGIEYPMEAVSFKDWPSRVRRPAYSALENAKLHQLGMSMPSWTDGVAAYIQDRFGNELAI